AFSFTIIITIFLIHGLFNQENQKVLFHLGPLAFYQEGLLYAARIGLNILNMLLAFATFVLTTKPADLVETMEQAGFSPRFGYMISSVFQIIPQMMGTMNTIMDAQRSRGMETEGSLLVRARAFIPLISPVVSSSLINTRERAIALEVRGFDSKNKKTFLREHRLAGRDKAFMALMALLIGVSVVWRVLTWL
ncbi:energy-coupling factor transporter transmembrane component T, partial [Lacrimispora sp.]|uniref:energy-coupling factor transporter transmembrane component T n=1 Tax=Lacrimispora sp. TaxID=2719234 RepID=UPI0028AEC503